MKNKPWTVINSLFHIASSAESLLGGNKKGAEYIASRYYDNIKYFLGLQAVQRRRNYLMNSMNTPTTFERKQWRPCNERFLWFRKIRQFNITIK